MRFQVFKNGKVVDKFVLSGAYLFGTDGIAIRKAQVTFEDGFIECKKPNMETAGLALLWPVEGFGRVFLPTTCLPERTQPYNLNVEIARAKLMQIVNKQEDWSFFENIEGLGDVSKETQELFIEAIQNISDAPQASRLADKSLERAVVFSERLATKQGELLFETRIKNHGFSRGCMGCKIDPLQIGRDGYVEKLIELFGFITIPLNWGQIEAQEGVYDFAAIDACINLLAKKKVVLGAGPLLCFSKEYLPKWLLGDDSEFARIRDSSYRFILKAVNRYAGSIRSWRVVSCPNSLNYFGFSFEQVLEITRAANMAVKAASEKALKVVEIGNPWGEYYAEVPNTIPPLVYMDMVVQSGINFDSFGLQMRFGKEQSGMHFRDMMHISAILDYFGHIAKPLNITETEVPSNSGVYNGTAADTRQQELGQSQQGQWLEHFYKIAFSKPFVDTVTYSSLVDTPDSVISNSGLLTNQLEPKKSFRTLKKLQGIIFSR